MSTGRLVAAAVHVCIPSLCLSLSFSLAPPPPLPAQACLTPPLPLSHSVCVCCVQAAFLLAVVGDASAAAVANSALALQIRSNRSAAYPPGTCGVTGEYDQAQSFGCASIGPDSRITGVSLADFGTPVGSCATGFTPGKCHEDLSAKILSLCKGKQSCAVTCLGRAGGAGSHPLTPRENHRQS